jgi:2-polyprenyl-3-methyl-5-hydroxy-6-metoxy-1,4-benzoquinol methylase
MKSFWDQRYSETDFAYGTAPNAFFKSIIDGLKPGKLLVPGAGEGRDAVYAATLGWDVLAFDQSEAGRQKAVALAKENKVGIRFEVADVQDFSTDEKFDAIALIFFHLPVPLRQSMHTSIKNWLAPGGHLILEAFHPNQLNYTSGGPKELSLLLTPEILADELTELTILQNMAQQTELSEGSFHKGLAEVVRLHAVKIG